MSLIRRISGDFRHLCKPAMVYLAISVVALVAIAYQNMGLSNMYCMGDFSCYVPSTSAVIFSEGLYILFWTWILNLMCRTGYASISWFMVVFPLVLFFVLIGLMMLASIQMTRQGRVKHMLPIESPVLADQDSFPAFGPMFPDGPRMREGFGLDVFGPMFPDGPRMREGFGPDVFGPIGVMHEGMGPPRMRPV